MDLSQRIKDIANNHDYFTGLTRDMCTCDKCQAKAPASIFEHSGEGMIIVISCCSSCGEILDIETTRLG
ncbi:hypothetical protein Dtox_2832 [Desulfofarcimen acetoxidans DSM 771]|uniref:Uncharacterized protein n=1 Tax=Desulfofarcimen acetoxidans (strain ATCC 49208 / DSM 771 / KCTC 5769 / VKM B-1644 / 5575) TaxID=485916 RepID=C8W1X6_DESAS|nr:hypothetical protein [Desulfofarcimen acetoxidans]ACV63597.1 hypothetical protein Dtox_2832 [Desulfofarcimen acetoxidans DSM 771]